MPNLIRHLDSNESDSNKIIESELDDKDTRKKGSKKVKIDFSKQKKRPSLLEPIIVTNLEGDWGFDEGEFPMEQGSQT